MSYGCLCQSVKGGHSVLPVIFISAVHSYLFQHVSLQGREAILSAKAQRGFLETSAKTGSLAASKSSRTSSSVCFLPMGCSESRPC